MSCSTSTTVSPPLTSFSIRLPTAAVSTGLRLDDLVPQQQLRLGRQRPRDFNEPALAVGPVRNTGFGAAPTDG
ncbi:hypothetical protein [Bradyrhizobium liaoningense]